MIAGPYSIGSDHWPGLSKLIEECGELQQVMGKILGTGGEEAHWDGSDLRQRLIEEMGDVRAAMIFVCERNGIAKADVHARADKKLVLFSEWHVAQEMKVPGHCNGCGYLLDTTRHFDTEANEFVYRVECVTKDCDAPGPEWEIFRAPRR